MLHDRHVSRHEESAYHAAHETRKAPHAVEGRHYRPAVYALNIDGLRVYAYVLEVGAHAVKH